MKLFDKMANEFIKLSFGSVVGIGFEMINFILNCCLINETICVAESNSGQILCDVTTDEWVPG